MTASRLFSRLYGLLEGHRLLLILVTIAVVAVACAVAYRGQLNEDIEAMLPDRGSRVATDFRLLQKAPLSRKGIVSLQAAPGVSLEALMKTTDRLAAAMTLPYFLQTAAGPDIGADPEIMRLLLGSLPVIADEEDIHSLDKALSGAAVRSKVKRVYEDLRSPTGWAMKGLYQADPLELRMIALRKLEALRIVPNVLIESNHFVSSDQRNTMIITEVAARMTDSGTSRQLVDHLDQLIKAIVPPGIKATFVSGHRYAVANADVIKTDVAIVVGSSSFAMLLLFVFFLRNWRAVFVFLVPVTVLAIASGVTLLLYSGVSAATIGFGSVLLGITDDFPLYVYFAARSGGDIRQKVGQVARPVIFSGITIVAAFAVLLFSNLPGQRQIGVFSIVGIAGSVALSLIVLPHLLRSLGKGKADTGTLETNPKPVKPRTVVFAWLLLLVLSLWQGTHVRFNGDLTSMSYTPPHLKEAEQYVRAAWGDFRSMAMVFSTGPDAETALATNDVVYRSLRAELPKAQLVSIAPILPSREGQRQNYERWMDFWRGTGGHAALGSLADASASLGFSSDAFSVFTDALEEPPRFMTPESLKSAGLGNLADALLIGGPTGMSVLTLVPDVPGLKDILARQPLASSQVRVVSPASFREGLSREILSNFLWYVVVAFLVIVFILMLLFRDLKKTAYSLIPVTTGMIYMVGAMGWLGITFNIFNIVAAILVIGISVDFGIFMIYRVTEGHDRSTDVAVLLGGLTTVSGVGMLILAHHPALHSVGTTVLLGLAGAIPSALFVIPALYHLCSEGAGRRGEG